MSRWLALVMLVALVGCTAKAETRTIRYDVGSMFNESEGKVSGDFFLGCGTVRGEQEEFIFAWVQKDRTSGWTRLQVLATHCYIFMDEEKNPWCEYTLCPNGYNGSIGRPYCIHEKAIFHVPAGTIIRRYELK